MFCKVLRFTERRSARNIVNKNKQYSARRARRRLLLQIPTNFVTKGREERATMGKLTSNEQPQRGLRLNIWNSKNQDIDPRADFH